MRRLAFVMIIVAALAAAAFSPTQQARAQERPFSFVPSECMFEGLDLGVTTMSGEDLNFECGYVIVPERHSNPDGPTIRLPVAIYRATGPSPEPDPLFLAQGGPGGDAFSVYSLIGPSSPVAQTRDLVIFNQRGTKYAEPDLSCTETQAIAGQVLAATSEEGEALYNDAIRACRERLVADGVDLSAYNSLESAADIDAIRQALGYEQFNFYGVSYGTLLGLHLMRLNPPGLRSVILDSVVPAQTNFVPESPRSEDRAYDELFANCDADPVCAQGYPNLEQRYFDLIEKLDREPVTLTLKDADTGESYPARLDGQALRGVMFQLLYAPKMPAVFPKVISDMEKGDFRYLELMWPLFAFDDSVSEGMYYSVICAEDADFSASDAPTEDVRPVIAATAEDELQSYLDSCALWDVDLLPASVDDPVVSSTPTLLLSGRFDPITPPYFAEQAAASLSNSTSLLDPLAGHGVAFLGECVNTVVMAFLDNPSQTPDGRCLSEQPPLKTVPPDAITFPLLAALNSPDAATVVKLIAATVLGSLLLSALVIWPAVYLIRKLSGSAIERTAQGKSTRRLSRLIAIIYAVLALLFGLGLLGLVVQSAFNLEMATALSIPAAAAPLLFVPLFLLVFAVMMVILAVLRARTPTAGSRAGNAYYGLLTAAAVGLVVVLATLGLLIPRL